MNLETRLAAIVYEEESLQLLEEYNKIEHGNDPISIVRTTENISGINLDKLFVGHEKVNSLIYSPFYKRNIMIYHYPNIFKKYYQVSYDIGISLDLNAMRYLEDYYTRGVDFEINNVKISDVINIRNIKGMQVNYLPYLIENTLFKEFDKKYLIKNISTFNQYFYSFNNTKINTLFATQSVEEFLSLPSYSKKMHKEIFKVLKATILFMFYIHNKHRRKSYNNKIKLLKEFYDKEIYQFLITELLLAKRYFNNENLIIFNKLSLMNNTLLEDIENLTWDLFHLKTMEINFRIPSPHSKCHTFFFLTFDKGILQIKDIYINYKE